MKKGVSPIIAAVLLIAVTVGIAAIVVNWASTFSKQETSKISSNTNTQCAGLSLKLEADPEIAADSFKLKLSNIGNDDFKAVKEMIIWDNDSVTTMQKQFTIERGGYAVVSFQDSDVNSGINFTNANTNSRTVAELRIFPETCESSPWVWSK